MILFSKKQEEKNYRAIQELLKDSRNVKCFDCQERISSYINLNHNTFICHICSGLLREINFRVKSISNSVFTKEEVDRLKAMGNEKAYIKWMAGWQRFYGDKKIIYKDFGELRQHLKDKYVLKKWIIGDNTIKQVPIARSTSLNVTSTQSSLQTHIENEEVSFVNLVRKPKSQYINIKSNQQLGFESHFISNPLPNQRFSKAPDLTKADMIRQPNPIHHPSSNFNTMNNANPFLIDIINSNQPNNNSFNPNQFTHVESNPFALYQNNNNNNNNNNTNLLLKDLDPFY